MFAPSEPEPDMLEDGYALQFSANEMRGGDVWMKIQNSRGGGRVRPISVFSALKPRSHLIHAGLILNASDCYLYQEPTFTAKQLLKLSADSVSK